MATIQERLDKMRQDNHGLPSTAPASGRGSITQRLDAMKQDNQLMRQAQTEPFQPYDPSKRFSFLEQNEGTVSFPGAKDRYMASDVADAESWLKTQSDKMAGTRSELERRESSWGDIRIAPPAATEEYTAAANRRNFLGLGKDPGKSYLDLAREYSTDQADFRANYDAYQKILRQIEDNADDYDAQAGALETDAGKKRQAAQSMQRVIDDGLISEEQAALMGYPEQIAALLKEADELDAQARPYRETGALIPGLRFQRKYGDLYSAPDFAEKSGYQEELTEEGPAANDLTRKWEYPLYEIVNGNDEAKDAYTARRMSLYGGALNPLGALWGGVADNAGEAQDMTEDEVALFNYLYHTQGQEAAQAFYDEIKGDLNARRRLREQSEWGEYAKEKPFESSLFSIVESPLRGMSYLGQLADLADDGKIDANAGYNRFTTVPGDIRAAISKEIEGSGKWGKAGSFLYQTGMSMGDFLMSLAASGGNEAFSLAIMGTGAAADTVITAKERGLSDRQAFALGTIAGAAEVITEKVSIETLLNKTALTENALGYFLKNVLAEGSEEVGSDLINLVADTLISKDKSEWKTAMRKLREENPELSEKEAFWRVFLDQAQQMGVDFLGGAISGGVMAGGSIAVNAAADYSAAAPTRRANSAISDAYAAMEEYGPFSTEARAAAEKAETRLRKTGNAWIGDTFITDQPEAQEDDVLADLPELQPGDPITGRLIRSVAADDALLRALGIESEGKSRSAVRSEVRTALETLRDSGAVAPDGDVRTETGSETAGDKAALKRDYSPAAGARDMLRDMVTESGIGTNGARVLETMYQGERATDYFGGFAAAYNAGTEGRALETVQTALSQKLTPEQRQAAWEAGQMDAIRAEAAETKNTPAAQRAAEASSREGTREAGARSMFNLTGGQVNAEGNDVSDGGGERAAGLRAGEQDGRLEGSARKTAAGEVRTAAQRHALVRDLRLQPADPVNDFKIRNAVNTGETYVLPEDQTDAPLRKIREDNRRSGVETVFILGSIPFRKTNGAIKRARGTYVPATNTVYVQVDNLSATPEQIAEHELWHARYQNMPQQDRLLEERIRERYSPEEFEKVLDRYISALAGVIDLHEGMTDAEYEAALGRIKNELFADAVSGLNGFGAGATQFTETTQQFRDEFWGSNSQTAEATESTTGPPAQFSFAERHVPTYEELIEKSPIEVVNLRGGASSNVGQMAHDFKKSAEAAEIIKEPVLNEDTQEQVFITPKTFEHSFSGISTNKIEAARKIREIIRTSVLTHSEPSRAERDHSTGVYTLFGVVRTEDGIRPVKLKVKEFRNEGQQLPANIREALGDDYETYARAYDNRVLVLDGIEKETSGSAGLATDEAVGRSGPEVSTVNVADLYSLVNSEYQKYLPQPSGAAQFSVDEDADTDELRRELRERGNVDTRRALADTDRAAFRENENQRRQLRKDIREAENRPKEIAAVERELARLRDTDYQKSLIDQGQDAVIGNYREIQRLEERLKRLRGETAEEKPAKGRKKAAKKTNAPTISVRQLQNDLLRFFSVPEGQRNELAKFVATFANKIYRDGKLTQADYDTMLDRLYGAGVVTVPADDYQRAGRNAVKDGRIYIPADLKAEFGDDWNRFRVAAMAAGVYLVNDSNARGADQWNVELSELFPGIFDAKDTDLRGIVEKIVQLAEEGKDQRMSLADYTAMLAGQEYTTEEQLQEGMERHIDWALRTFAEKAGLEVFLKDRSDARVQQERAAAWERRQAEQQRKKADRELRELQQKTLKQLQWLSANRNKAPAELRQAFDDVLSDIDIYAASAANELNWSKRYQMTWRDLVDLYEAKTNKASEEYDPNFFPSEELKRIYERLRVKKQHIADMDLGTLQDLYKAAAGLRQEVYDRNNLLGDEFNRTIAGAYYDSKAELEAAAKKRRKRDVLGTYRDMQLTPMNRFAQMAGWNKDSTWASMARMLEKGERDQRRFTVNAKAMLADFLKQNEKWVQRADGQGKDGIWYEVEFAPVAEWGEMDKPIFGTPVKVWMTPAMKVQLYLESKSEDNLRHMAGGRTFADKELYARGERSEAYANGRTFKMTPEAVRHIVSDLTPEEKALADVLERFYNEFSKGEINRVSNVLYGYDKAMGRYYAPIFTDSNYTQSSPGVFDLTAEGVGNLKERKKSWTPSMMISAFDAFEKSVDKTAKFVGLSVPIRNLYALWNWWEDGSSMKDVVEHAQGQEAAKFVEDLMTELQGNKEMKHPKLEQLMDKALSKYVSAVFGFNPSIVLKQFASFPLAASYLGWGNMPKWIPGAAQVDRELIRSYTGELAYRNMGYATPETALLKDNPGALQKKGVLNFVFGGGAINWMDDFTVRSLWSWAENKVRKEQPNLKPGTQTQIDAGEDAFYKAVASEFEEAVSRSQPMYDTMHRSQVMREASGLTRAFTMFKTVPQQEFNMLAEAFGEMSAAKASGDTAAKKVAAAKVGRAVSGVLVGNLMIGAITFLNALLKNGAKGYRDDDGELTPESVMEQFGAQYFRDSIGLTIGGDVVADVLGAAFGARWYGVEAPGVEQVNEILEGISNAGKNAKRLVQDSITIASNGGDWKKYMREHGYLYVTAVEDAVKLLGTYAGGLPVNNVRAYLLGALQWMSPEIKVAYEDAVKHADRDGLKGLAGDALEMRMEHILQERIGEPSEELTQTIAGLYAAGYKEAVPTSVPTSVSIDSVDHKLDLVQQQTYSNVWQASVGEALEELIESEAFQRADEKTRSAMVKKIYDYAANAAKGAVFDEFDAADANKRAEAVMAAGATLRQFSEISTAFAAIDANKSATSAQRGVQKRAAVLEMDLTDQEKLDVYAAMSDAEKRSEKLQTIYDTGLRASRAFEIYDRYDEISNSGVAASEKAASFSKWIDEQHFTDKQAAAIREQLTFSSFVPASGGTYDKFRDAGLTTARSYQLFETMRALDPEEGKTNVSDGQKLRAIDGMAMSDDEKIKAFGVILGTDMVSESGNPTGYAKMLNVLAEGVPISSYLDLREAGQVDGFLRYRDAAGGKDYGITPEIYISYRETLPQYDADGNNSYTQKEVQAALDAIRIGSSGQLGGLGRLGGGELTRQQKAVLWQLANSSWKPSKNPYDTAAGQAIYDGLHTDKETLTLGGSENNPLYRAALGMARDGLLS